MAATGLIRLHFKTQNWTALNFQNQSKAPKIYATSKISYYCKPCFSARV